ncbi:MAG: NAD+ synthase [Planctomycetes bacterium]|nr:NAD+ synthase [Planctomycetota bacterium]
MKVALAQINTTVADIDGNTARILDRLRSAQDAGADLVVFPELSVFGYPPKDLVRRRDLVQRNVAALERIAGCCTSVTAVVGFVAPDPGGGGTGILNAAAVCRGGRIIATYAKRLLPTYDVFDESRYFNVGDEVRVVPCGAGGSDTGVGLTICEDLWNDRQFEDRRIYGVDPVAQTVAAGAGLLLNLSASPYRAGKQEQRERLFTQQVRDHGVSLVYVNLVGGNDDLLFDGASLTIDAQGNVVARAKAFDEDLLLVDLSAPDTARRECYPRRIEGIRRALVMGLRDYIVKCGFGGVVLGLSGGVDSAVTAVLAVEAVGRQSVHGVAMPSRYSSAHSLEDAGLLAENLGIRFSVLPIEGVHRAAEQALVEPFAGTPPGIAEENVQARIRGTFLMALSNKSGALLLTTGNKSELAVGYCTLYGDMCGGLAVLSDVPKTVVYELARHLNATWTGPCIPQRTLDKPPSAELKPDQADQDTLPPYEVLDAILELYVEQELCVADIATRGLDPVTVERVARWVDRSEYKRKQAAVGLKVTSRAFGTGRRMPIAARY